MRRRGAGGGTAVPRSPGARAIPRRKPATAAGDAATAREQHEHRLAAIFAASTDCMTLVDGNGTITDLNPAGERLLKAPAENGVVGKPLRDLVAPEYQLAVEGALAQAFAGKSAQAECQAIGEAGRRLWLEFSTAPIVAESGAIASVLAVVRDVTHGRLAEERLRESEKLEAIGRLTGGVAHDFNNILTVIIGNSEILGERLAADPDARRLAETSLEAARSGADLTRMLLAYSRRQALQPTEFCAADMLREIRSLLERSLGDHVDIDIAADPDPWGIVADRAQLASVMLNLALNARDAMPRGGRIAIEARNASLAADDSLADSEVAAGDYVMIAVSDTGMGIPAHIIDRVFEPFFTTKELGKGSGLGLSMVYGFARQSGGHVKLRSEPGVGTTVSLFLPRHQVQLRLPNVDLESEDHRARPGETVMVVEDNRPVRELIVSQLEALGYRAVAASDGKSALAQLRGLERLDLLLTDVVMPGIDGIRLAERAKRLRAGLRVVLTSGHADQAIDAKRSTALAGPFLAKPFSRQELARRIRAAIDGRL